MSARNLAPLFPRSVLRMMSCFLLGLFAFSGAALADQIVSSIGYNFFSPVPGCGGSASGSTSASVSFNCTGGDLVLQGSAAAQVGLGPFGIGANWDLTATAGGLGANLSTRVESTASLNWSQQFVLDGATGSGFLEPAFATVGAEGCLLGGCNQTISINGTGFSLSDVDSNSLPAVPSAYSQIPVTYGEPFSVTITGTPDCDSNDQTGGCGYTSFDLSDLAFFDSNGNSLAGVTLVPVPQPTSVTLMSTMLLAVAFVARKRIARRAIRTRG
jgi:hypothetical protein